MAVIPFPHPGKKYGIIYADPPWQYASSTELDTTRSRGPEKHYNTMSTADICNLPVADIAAENCVLLIWGTWPYLADIQQVITAWGFEYKTCGFIWVKRYASTAKHYVGMGGWTRSNTEYCLLATKGKPTRVSAGISEVIEADVKEHSKKPNVVRTRIVELLGNEIPRIELFARTIISGWDTWGNDPKLQYKPLEHFESIDSFEVDSEVIK